MTSCRKGTRWEGGLCLEGTAGTCGARGPADRLCHPHLCCQTTSLASWLQASVTAFGEGLREAGVGSGAGGGLRLTCSSEWRGGGVGKEHREREMGSQPGPRPLLQYLGSDPFHLPKD